MAARWTLRRAAGSSVNGHRFRIDSGPAAQATRARDREASQCGDYSQPGQRGAMGKLRCMNLRRRGGRWASGSAFSPRRLRGAGAMGCPGWLHGDGLAERRRSRGRNFNGRLLVATAPGPGGACEGIRESSPPANWAIRLRPTPGDVREAALAVNLLLVLPPGPGCGRAHGPPRPCVQSARPRIPLSWDAFRRLDCPEWALANGGWAGDASW